METQAQDTLKNPLIEDLTEYLKNASESLHIVDSGGMIVWANNTELDFLGYSEEDYIGHSITEFHRDTDVINDILTRLLAGETLVNYSAYLIAKNGSIKRVLINSNGFWKDGKFIHTRCFSRDITELPMPEGTGYLT
ncbi:MAG: PAS domain-containing protein [Bacteroidia bacterium]|nr:PAS domain-containing protein [Bacteroidia bacterium]MBL4715327.1 PAS domain-containing protein [Bacteroidia bacterium]